MPNRRRYYIVSIWQSSFWSWGRAPTRDAPTWECAGGEGWVPAFARTREGGFATTTRFFTPLRCVQNDMWGALRCARNDMLFGGMRDGDGSPHSRGHGRGDVETTEGVGPAFARTTGGGEGVETTEGVGPRISEDTGGGGYSWGTLQGITPIPRLEEGRL